MSPSLDLAGTGTLPLGGHRMIDPATRIRALALVAIMVTISWGAIATLGKPSCAAFSQRETRELAGLPIPPACVTQRISPEEANPIGRLGNELTNNQPFSGATP